MAPVKSGNKGTMLLLTDQPLEPADTNNSGGDGCASGSVSTPDDQQNTNSQAGLEIIETTAKTWTRPWIVATYILICIVFFTDSLQQQMAASLLPYVTSSFGFHGLLATTSIIAVIIAGVSKPPLARILDVTGRNQGLIIMLVITVISLIVMATCGGIQAFAAAQVFYWTGINGIGYVLSIFIADTTTLRNRMILFGLTTTPYIPNTFAGPAAAQAFLEGSTWRWSYGAFSVIIPIICAPVIAVFAFHSRKAKSLGLISDRGPEERRTMWQKVMYWVVELDLVGVLLCAAGLSLTLMPLSLANYQVDKWRSQSVISMLVIGVLCLVAVLLYEKYAASQTFIPFALLKNRNVLVACLMSGNIWISFFCSKLFFSSYLQVVYNVSVSEAGYIGNIFSVVICTWAVPVGLLMRWSDRFRWLALVSVPIWILFTGLMLKFRMPGTKIGYIIMCEVFTSLSGGTLIQVQQIAAMSAVQHHEVALSLALVSLSAAVGGAVGQSISGAIWTNTLPGKLKELLPDELKAEWPVIYGDLNVQLEYEWGSPVREAVARAYGETQKSMLLAALLSSVGSLVWVSMMRNERLSDKQHTKGTLL
ncbi:Siderophore iron transporter mirB [Cytospora mali]|uniref:Siderophore iron transporter mirB n=1 Tax=Cytospora mali TaxID=578113 RepID=A0A194WA51_CYTMA|nr:Siderophore iron transporter mirB [Valsa mali]